MFAQRGRLGAYQMHVDAQALAVHAARVLDARGCRRCGGRSECSGPARARRGRCLSSPVGVDPAKIGVAHLVTVDLHLDAEIAGIRASGGNVDDDAVQPFPHPFLGGADRGQDRRLRGIHVDDRAPMHAAGRVMPHAPRPGLPPGCRPAPPGRRSCSSPHRARSAHRSVASPSARLPNCAAGGLSILGASDHDAAGYCAGLSPRCAWPAPHGAGRARRVRSTPPRPRPPAGGRRCRCRSGCSSAARRPRSAPGTRRRRSGSRPSMSSTGLARAGCVRATIKGRWA